MYNIIHKYTIIFIFLFIYNSYSQENHCSEYSQKYSICNETLNINVSTNKHSISEFDTLLINFKVTNVSTDTIALFLKPIWEFYYSNDSTLFKIIINYGNNYTPDFENEISFIALNKLATKSFKYQLLPGKYDLNYVENIQIIFGISFVPDLAEVDHKLIDENLISVNNHYILKYLRDFSSKTLNVIIKK